MKNDLLITPQRSISTNSHHGAAIGTSCQPPLPIYPPSDDDHVPNRQDKGVDELERYSTRDSARHGPIVEEPLTPAKKNILLGLFCLGVFMDGESRSVHFSPPVLCVCAFYILLTPVSEELGIEFTQQTWIVVSNQTLHDYTI